MKSLILDVNLYDLADSTLRWFPYPAQSQYEVVDGRNEKLTNYGRLISRHVLEKIIRK